MWIKHIITDNHFTIALKYCPKRNELVIGGRLKFYDIIRKVQNKFNEVPGVPWMNTFPNPWYIRTRGVCCMDTYNVGFNELKNDDSIIVQSTRKLGRIMR